MQTNYHPVRLFLHKCIFKSILLHFYTVYFSHDIVQRTSQMGYRRPCVGFPDTNNKQLQRGREQV